MFGFDEISNLIDKISCTVTVIDSKSKMKNSTLNTCSQKLRRMHDYFCVNKDIVASYKTKSVDSKNNGWPVLNQYIAKNINKS